MADTVRFSQVTACFGDVELFADVSITLAAGSFHFLTGPSGAGKTTFLRLCFGDRKPSGGRVEILGQDIGRLGRNALADLRPKIGFVHQEARFLDHLPMSENVALPLRIAGRLNGDGQNDRDELLDWVGLAARADGLPPELSGGERQRAALARAVMLSPELVLADEPTGNVDWEMSLRLLGLLVELNRMGKTVLMATHDIGLIRAARGMMADPPGRILRLSEGRLSQAGVEL